MTVTKWMSSDPEVGSPIFSQSADPAMADKVVHFVGRRRGGTPLPASVRNLLSAEDRLANILACRQLHGFPVPRSNDTPAVCLSDLTAAELEAAFHKGLNIRGPVEPWGLVFFRVRTWELGFRPVAYADAQKLVAYRLALEDLHGPGWAALAVPTEMRTGAFREDWTTEREWRYCFAPGQPTALGIPRGVAAVIVGRSGWTTEFYGPPSAVPPQRWLWDADSKSLVHDGRIPLW